MLIVSIVGLAVLTTFAIPQGMGMGPGNRQDMQTIHALLAENKKVKRTVKDLPNGVETLTESKDKKTADLIKAHTLAMAKRVKTGAAFRHWDPLFAEIFANHKKIKMSVELTSNGVKVRETSDDPYAVRLIQWHAQAVNGFVKDGMAGMHKSHPAPPKGDVKPKPEFLGKGDGITTCPVTGEPVDKKVSVVINGRTVYFCCAGCIETVKKAPAKYLKPPKK